MAVMKEYYIRRHYAKHQDKYRDLDMKQKLQKVEEMKRSLVSQQTMFTKAKSQSEAALKASFIVVAEIAKLAQPFNEGEFVKKCLIIMCPDKQAFINVSLSRNTATDHACELATNLHEQLMERGKYFIGYSLAVDESNDI